MCTGARRLTALCLCCAQVGETEPFICELLTNLTGIIQDLETHQIHMFYETVGLMISAETVPEKRDEYVVRGSVFPPDHSFQDRPHSYTGTHASSCFHRFTAGCQHRAAQW